MEMYTFEIPEMINNANVIKEVILVALEKDGLLKKPAEDIANEYAVIITKPGWLGSLFKKLCGNGDPSKNKLEINMVKLVGPK